MNTRSSSPQSQYSKNNYQFTLLHNFFPEETMKTRILQKISAAVIFCVSILLAADTTDLILAPINLSVEPALLPESDSSYIDTIIEERSKLLQDRFDQNGDDELELDIELDLELRPVIISISANRLIPEEDIIRGETDEDSTRVEVYYGAKLVGVDYTHDGGMFTITTDQVADDGNHGDGYHIQFTNKAGYVTVIEGIKVTDGTATAQSPASTPIISFAIRQHGNMLSLSFPRKSDNSIIILSLAGRRVFSSRTSTAAMNIPLHTLSKGTYIARLKSGSRTLAKQIQVVK
jgi:hypothetical protein